MSNSSARGIRSLGADLAIQGIVLDQFLILFLICFLFCGWGGDVILPDVFFGV